MIDHQAILYGPQYVIQGTDAVLTLPDSTVCPIRVLDKTVGVDISNGKSDVATIKPAAAVRVPELTALGVTMDRLPGSVIVFNGASWNVLSFRLRPSGNGEMDGEVYLVLSGRTPFAGLLDSESEST